VFNSNGHTHTVHIAGGEDAGGEDAGEEDAVPLFV
jgi:hypothetical protein